MSEPKESANIEATREQLSQLPVEQEKSEWAQAHRLLQQAQDKNPTQKNFKIKRKANNFQHSYIAFTDPQGKIHLARVANAYEGKGEFGKVKQLVTEDGKVFALKIMDPRRVLKGDPETHLMNDLGILEADFILEGMQEKVDKTLKQAMKDKRYLVMPYYPGEDLNQLIKNNALKTEEQKLAIAQALTHSVENLHQHRILHRDIRGANVRVKIKDQEVHAVSLFDLGAAIKLNEDGKIRALPAGAQPGLPPESGGGPALIKAAMNFQQHRQQVTSIQEKIKKHEETFEEELSSLNDEIEEAKEAIEQYTAGIEKLKKGETTEKSEAKIQKYQAEIEELQENIRAAENKTQLLKDEGKNLAHHLQEAKRNLATAQNHLNALYSTEYTLTSAVDIYALGVLFQRELKLDLAALGLENMLAPDPEQRPKPTEISKKIEQYQIKKKEQEQQRALAAEQAQLARQQEINKIKAMQKNNQTQRIPAQVPVDKLYLHNGKISVLSADEMQQYLKIKATIAPGNEGAIVKIGQKNILFTAQGDAFVLAAKLGQGAFGAVYLAQNIENDAWTAAKVLEGPFHKVRGKIGPFAREASTLKDLGKLTGTIDISSDNGNEIHMSFQPYVHGKEYWEIYQSQPQIPEDEAVLMALKAIEAVYEYHEEKGFLHRDIKLDNLMWDDVTKSCHLIDDGNAVKAAEITENYMYGTMGYLAPELNPTADMTRAYDERTYNQKTDVYAIGVVIEKLAEKLDKKSLEYQQLSQLAKDLMSPANQRPTTAEALQKALKIAKQNQNISPHHLQKAQKWLQKHAPQQKGASTGLLYQREMIRGMFKEVRQAQKSVKVAPLIKQHEKKIKDNSPPNSPPASPKTTRRKGG